MGDKPYALLCANDYKRRTHEMPPAVVAKVWNHTEKSIIGMMVNRAGKEVDDWQVYDMRPSTMGWGEKLTVARPGRFDRERLLSTYATVDEAYAALDASSEAWKNAEDRSAEEAANEHWRAARHALAERKKELEQEMREKLAAVQHDYNEAEKAMWEARREKFGRMREAATAALSAEHVS